MVEKKWVYLFNELEQAEAYVGGDWDNVRGLLGGKGANLAEMTRIGLPVPPFFTVTTEACNAYTAGGEQIPRRDVGTGTGSAEEDRRSLWQEIWRSDQPAAGLLPLGRQVLDARYDGHRSEHWPER